MVAEVQLPGIMCPDEYVHPPTNAPTGAPSLAPKKWCKELLRSMNADAENDPFKGAPFTKYTAKGPVPQVKTEDGNRYFAVEGRLSNFHGVRVVISPECIAQSWPYILSFRYRVHGGGTPVSAEVRMLYRKPRRISVMEVRNMKTISY